MLSREVFPQQSCMSSPPHHEPSQAKPAALLTQLLQGCADRLRRVSGLYRVCVGQGLGQLPWKEEAEPGLILLNCVTGSQGPAGPGACRVLSRWGAADGEGGPVQYRSHTGPQCPSCTSAPMKVHLIWP